MTLILVFALAAFTGSAFYFVRETTRTWHENDVALRARLALRGARRALIEKWHVAYQVELSDELHEITRDERIMAAAACAADLTTLAETRGYPSGFSCATLARYVRDQNADAQAPWHAWFGVFRLPGGNIHVSAIPLFDNTALGFVVLIHDLSYVQRREAQTLRFLFAGFVLYFA